MVCLKQKFCLVHSSTVVQYFFTFQIFMLKFSGKFSFQGFVFKKWFFNPLFALNIIFIFKSPNGIAKISVSFNTFQFLCYFE